MDSSFYERRINLSGALIVSYDFSNGKDKAILLVGKKKPGKDVEVINAFQGKEAEDIKYSQKSNCSKL